MLTERAEFSAIQSSERIQEKGECKYPMTECTVRVGEFWPAKQRGGHSLHEVSYRGCFKPELAEFFIQKFTKLGDVVCDPFMGRGTTALEAALLGRRAVGVDANPLGKMLVYPRLNPPRIGAISKRLEEIPWARPSHLREDLLAFYHQHTLEKISALREYFLERQATNELDAVDAWIRLVALSRLSGHSAGFFSVRTMPPNQAVPISRQLSINKKNHQTPEYRDVASLILKKSHSLLRDLTTRQSRELDELSADHHISVGYSENLHQVADESVQLVITSPPFLNVVNYRQDNWLRCWFAGIGPESIPTLTSSPTLWTEQIRRAMLEMLRIVRAGCHIAIEVGEIKKGKIKMEDLVTEAGNMCGVSPCEIYLHTQRFTKTSHCWGIENNLQGTNTHRVVVFQKPTFPRTAGAPPAQN